MKYEEIQALLDRYWEGETSLEEERRIKAYFNSGSVDERMRAFAPLFSALKEEQSLQLASKAKMVPMRPQMYQWAIAASIALLMVAGWWLFKEQQPATTQFAETPVVQPQTVIPSPPTEKQPEVIAQAPAASPRINQPRRKSPPKAAPPVPKIDTETALAMEEIKAALALVSSKLDKGKAKAVKGALYLDTMEKLPRRKNG